MTVGKKTPEGLGAFVSYLREVGLLDGVKAIALRHAVTIEDLFAGMHLGQSLRAARLETWWWLVGPVGKSTAEVARIFQRNPSTIAVALKRLGEHAAAMGAALEESVDAGTVARDLSKAKRAALRESGTRVSKLGLAASLAKRAANG